MAYRTLIILFPLLFMVVSCGGAAGTPFQAVDEVVAIDLATSTPTEAAPVAEPPTSTPTAIVTASPTAIPGVESEPTEETPLDIPTSAPGQEPTVSPPSPTPLEEPTATPSLPPTPRVSGVAGFGNNLATTDKFLLNLSGVPAPPAGQTYQGWLMADDGTATSVGVFNVGSDGSVVLEWNSPNSENLLSHYAGFQVTLEPAGGSASPTGQVILTGGFDGQTLTNARRLFVKNESEPVTPLNTAFALGLMAQTDIALQHVQNAVNAAAIGALPETRTHLEHVVNILEGAVGPRFGDHDGNGNAENPGDGFGVIGYAGQMATLFNHQPAVVEAATGVTTQVSAIQDKALQVLTLDDMGTVTAQLAELQALANQLKADPVTQLYQAGQTAASFKVTPLE
ncbi:MAG: anti-sigma factor [Anaerolineae bacterium]|nr:anti-sigma factor [Anaerolineae bacterium]